MARNVHKKKILSRNDLYFAPENLQIRITVIWITMNSGYGIFDFLIWEVARLERKRLCFIDKLVKCSYNAV